MFWNLFKKKKPIIIEREVPHCAECGGRLGLGIPVTSNDKGIVHLGCDHTRR